MPINILHKHQVWPEWTIGRRIGSGAYGTVYEARRSDYNVQNYAAIKIVTIPSNEAEVDSLRATGMDMQSTRNHFQTVVNDYVNEIRLMVSLEGQSNIVSVRDYKVVEKTNEFGWHIFILMEYLTPFADYIGSRQITESEVIRLGTDICTALEVCAKESIIHRDIKPGNILVHKSGAFKLGDFGIARKLENMTGGLSRRYTPKYMAPETATSTYYDSRVDIYSLGIVLYELLNNRRIPFQANRTVTSPIEIDTAVRRRNAGEALPPPCNASPAMADVILRACAFDPAMRFPSATAMKQALAQVANGTYVVGATAYGTPFVGAAPQFAYNGTAAAANPQGYNDGTVSVRKPQNAGDSTVFVRKPQGAASSAGSAYYAPEVNTFGEPPKKNNKVLKTIAAVAAALLLLLCGFLLARNLVSDKNSSSDQPATLATTPSATNQGSNNNQGSSNPSTTPAPTTPPINTAPAFYNNTLNLDTVIKGAPYYGAAGSYLIDDRGTLQYHQPSLDFYGPSGVVEGAKGVSDTDGKDSVTLLTSDGSIVTIPGSKAVIVNVDATGMIVGSNGQVIGQLKNGTVTLPTITSEAEWALPDATSWKLKYFKEDANVRQRPDSNAPTIKNLPKGTIAFYIYKQNYWALVVTFIDRQPTLCWVRWASLTDNITKNCQLYTVTATDSLTVRDIPSTEGKKVHSFPAGTIVEGYGHPGEWYFVKYPGGYGWCHEDYLERNVDAEKRAGIYIG